MTERRKTSSDIRKKINSIYEENELAGLLQNKNRSRSLTVGTAFGGAIEINMRGDYATLYALMQPVEVVELIESLAASAGLQVALRPKKDFASWRSWEENVEDRYWVGSAPWNCHEVIEGQNNQNLLTPSKQDSEDSFEEVQQDDSESLIEKQKRRNNKTRKIHSERTKEELEIQKEIMQDSAKDAKSNLEKIRKESINHLNTLRNEIELDMEKKIKDSQKIHDKFVDDVME
jgi:hypothetical protein